MDRKDVMIDLHKLLVSDKLLFSPSLFALLHGIKFQVTGLIQEIVQLAFGEVFSFSWALRLTFASFDVISARTSVSGEFDVSMESHVSILADLMIPSFRAPEHVKYSIQLLCQYLYSHVHIQSSTTLCDL